MGEVFRADDLRLGQPVALKFLPHTMAKDDSMLARLAHVDLTSVSQDARDQAEQAIALAVERLEGGRMAPREVVLSPHLVVRSTTAPPPGD